MSLGCLFTKVFINENGVVRELLVPVPISEVQPVTHPPNQPSSRLIFSSVNNTTHSPLTNASSTTTNVPVSVHFTSTNQHAVGNLLLPTAQPSKGKTVQSLPRVSTVAVTNSLAPVFSVTPMIASASSSLSTSRVLPATGSGSESNFSLGRLKSIRPQLFSDFTLQQNSGLKVMSMTQSANTDYVSKVPSAAGKRVQPTHTPSVRFRTLAPSLTTPVPAYKVLCTLYPTEESNNVPTVVPQTVEAVSLSVAELSTCDDALQFSRVSAKKGRRKRAVGANKRAQPTKDSDCIIRTVLNRANRGLKRLAAEMLNDSQEGKSSNRMYRGEEEECYGGTTIGDVVKTRKRLNNCGQQNSLVVTRRYPRKIDDGGRQSSVSVDNSRFSRCQKLLNACSRPCYVQLNRLPDVALKIRQVKLLDVLVKKDDEKCRAELAACSRRKLTYYVPNHVRELRGFGVAQSSETTTRNSDRKNSVPKISISSNDDDRFSAYDRSFKSECTATAVTAVGRPSDADNAEELSDNFCKRCKRDSYLLDHSYSVKGKDSGSGVDHHEHAYCTAAVTTGRGRSREGRFPNAYNPASSDVMASLTQQQSVQDHRNRIQQLKDLLQQQQEALAVALQQMNNA